MTYNFDPDRWLDNELAALEAALAAGRMTKAECDRLKAERMRRYDAMLDRLDGTYRIDGDGHD